MTSYTFAETVGVLSDTFLIEKLNNQESEVNITITVNVMQDSSNPNSATPGQLRTFNADNHAAIHLWAQLSMKFKRGKKKREKRCKFYSTNYNYYNLSRIEVPSYRLTLAISLIIHLIYSIEAEPLLLLLHNPEKFTAWPPSTKRRPRLDAGRIVRCIATNAGWSQIVSP